MLSQNLPCCDFLNSTPPITMLQPNTLPIYSPNLEQVIERSPLIVSPDTPLVDVITLMGQMRASCSLNEPTSMPEFNLVDEVRDGCVLVMEGSQLLGMFTERDVVKLSAAGGSLTDQTIDQVMTREIVTLAHSNFQDLFDALSLMRQHRIRHLPILDNNGELLGVVSHGSIRKVLQPFNLLKVRSVSEVMNCGVITAPPTASLLHLAELMSGDSVSCVVISKSSQCSSSSHRFAQNSDRIPMGIVTERDIVQFQALGLDLRKTQAETVMSAPLFSLDPEDSLWTAHQVMQQRGVRRLVVTGDRGELLGLVTQTNLLRVFDPIEMYRVIEILQESVEERTLELTQTNQQLQQEIIERERAQQDLHKALQTEKELNELKSRFTSMVTHEFRNPLTTILCSAQLLEHFSDRATEEQKQSYVVRIKQTAKYMNQMIEDLLVIGGAETGKLEFKPAPLDLIKFCRDLVEEQLLSDRNRHVIIFELRGACANACMDEKLLRYIFGNLLTNACKYSPRNSTIDFEVSCEDGKAVFLIRDRGIGIPPEDKKRLFESFYRAKNVGSIPGTGLGLTIVKNCVEVHGGEIVVDTKVGIGTTFTVTLPLSRLTGDR